MTDTVAVQVDIVVRSEPLQGVVTVGEEAPRGFRSWLELIVALESASSGDAASRSPS